MTLPWQTVSGVWPLGERLLLAALRDAVPVCPVNGVRREVTVTTETGSNLLDLLPLLRVHQLAGGVSDGLDDEAVVDVESMAPTRLSMWELAGLAHQAVLLLPTTSPDVDEVHVDSTPGYVDYGNPDLRRAIATYRLTTRAQTTVV